MEYYKCAFNGALIGKQYGCQCAMDITRREGPAIGCVSQSMQQKCALLLDKFKVAALPEFGYVDDLTQMPHSVLMKIQMGGLAGLQKVLQNASELAPVEDIRQLVMDAESQYGDVMKISVKETVPDMLDFKLTRRRR